MATAGSHRGEHVAAHTPSLAAAYPTLDYVATEPSALEGLDLVFVALPHGQSQKLMPDLISKVATVVDLAADFRLADPALYPRWYGEAHAAPQLLERFVYGLPELYREELAGAHLIAAPGCYPTAALLALAPLVRAGVLALPEAGGPGPEGGPHGVGPAALIVDAASGVSGAGRAPKDNLHFGAVDEDFVAYGLLDHRHTAEMEQGLGAPVLFTPHLAPMVRGILATCYAPPSGPDPTEPSPPPTCSASSTRPTTTNLSSWSPTAALHQGDQRIEPLEVKAPPHWTQPVKHPGAVRTPCSRREIRRSCNPA